MEMKEIPPYLNCYPLRMDCGAETILNNILEKSKNITVSAKREEE